MSQTIATERAASVHSTQSLSSPRNEGDAASRARASTGSVRSAGRKDIVAKAKEVVDAANDKINRLTEASMLTEAANVELKQDLAHYRATEERRSELNYKYKQEIGAQRQTIIDLKAAEERLTAQIDAIRSADRARNALYTNNLASIHDTLEKVQGDQISKLKYSKTSAKFVVFTRRLNHLFYHDEQDGHAEKLLFVKGIATSHEAIDESSIGGEPQRWFLVLGKKRNALFIAKDKEMRDKWVDFVKTSLHMFENNGEDEFSVLTSLIDHDENSQQLSHNEMDIIEPTTGDDDMVAPLSALDETVAASEAAQLRKRGLSSTLHSLGSKMSMRNASKRRDHQKSGSASLILGRNNSSQVLSKHKRQNSGSMSGASQSTMYESSTRASAEEENGPVHVIVSYEIREDKLELFMKSITPIIKMTNKDPACLRYNIHQDKRNKCKLVMVEEWTSQKALTAHLKQEHLKAYRKRIMKLGVHECLPSVNLCRPMF